MEPALVTTSQFDVRPGSRPVGRGGMGKVDSYICQSSTGHSLLITTLKFGVRLQLQLEKEIKKISFTFPLFLSHSHFSFNEKWEYQKD